MRVVVVGGSGRTGRLIVDALVAKGDTAVATIRNPKHMAELVKAGAETVMLDLEKSTGPEFQHVFKGADAVVFAAGSSEGEGSALDRAGVVKTLRAAVTAGVRRYLNIASIGASTGMRLTGQLATDEMKDYYKQKRAANKAVLAAKIDGIIIEPGELTDGGATGKVRLSQQAINEESVSRADVAAVIVALLHEPKAAGKAFQLTRGPNTIATALKKAVGE